MPAARALAALPSLDGRVPVAGRQRATWGSGPVRGGPDLHVAAIRIAGPFVLHGYKRHARIGSDELRTCASRRSGPLPAAVMASQATLVHDHPGLMDVCGAIPPGRLHSVIGFIRTVIVTSAWLWHRPAGAQEAGAGSGHEDRRDRDLFPRRCVRVLAAVAFLASARPRASAAPTARP